jgi:energy-coupling factor transport system ATP-binding protein
MDVTQSNQAIIECKDISFSYQYGEEPPVRVFEHLDLAIGQGEFVAVLGHNGSGKSTLAKHFNAILLPEGGHVYAAGIDTADESRLFDIRGQVGMVFQNPDNQIVATVVEEDVAFALENLGVPPPEIRRRVDGALRSVGMYDFREHAPHQLSGGQKQRVAIAGVIAMRPRCIVLDEPTAMLDPRGRREVMGTLHDLCENHGITVVLITHFMDEAADSRRVVVMDHGEIILDAPPAEVFAHVDRLHEVGLDVPQASELIHALRQEGISLPASVITVEECVETLAGLFAG